MTAVGDVPPYKSVREHALRHGSHGKQFACRSGQLKVRPQGDRKGKQAPQVTATRVTDVDAPNFRQELIYNGRSGETVSFSTASFPATTHGHRFHKTSSMT